MLFNSVQSRAIPVTSDVPGSHLRPLLFVNEFPECIQHSSGFMVADDFKLSFSYNSLCGVKLLEFDLRRVYFWCGTNGMILNS